MPSSEEISRIRNEYLRAALSEDAAGSDPLALFEKWLNEAIEAEVAEPTAFTLASADTAGRPSARIVLLKGFDARGFVFYTNYESRKGRELSENDHVCLNFAWLELQRQVRIDGRAVRVSRDESREYFLSRPPGSRIGAIASPQSKSIPNREFLENEFERVRSAHEDDAIPLPDYWGGYRVAADAVEFWQGRENRLHDRFLFTRESGQADASPDAWKRDRLAP